MIVGPPPPEQWGAPDSGSVRVLCPNCKLLMDTKTIKESVECSQCGKKFTYGTWVDRGGVIHHRVGSADWIARHGDKPRFEIGDKARVVLKPNTEAWAYLFHQHNKEFIVRSIIDHSAGRMYNEHIDGPFFEPDLVLVEKAKDVPEEPGRRRYTIKQVPNDIKFVREIAQRLCLAAGDSWDSDDGAQDIYSADVLDAINAINATLRELRNKSATTKNL